MDGTARFLLGGALGAALGYLLSQKNLQKALLTAVSPAGEAQQLLEPAPAGVPTCRRD